MRTSGITSDLGIAMTVEVGANETAPEIGRQYVFYVKDSTRPGGARYDAVKLGPTTEFGPGVRGF
jgi:hypothetical protein